MGSLDQGSTYDVLIVGAGFAGLYLLHRLRKLGFSVHLFEAGASLGGTWFWNCYPGARVDSEVPIYQFASEEVWRDWEWSERYPGWQEIQRYFKHVDRVWNLSPDISFNARVNSAHWCNGTRKWTITAGPDDGIGARSNFIIFCTGFAAKPYIPAIKGLSQFKGEAYHTAAWPTHEISLTDKRVGVIGTGASGVQVIQELGPIVSHLTVFQRTPNTALPMNQEVLDHDANQRIKKEYSKTLELSRNTFCGFLFDFAKEKTFDVPEDERLRFYETLWNKGGFNFWMGSYRDIVFDRSANNSSYDFWREKTISRIKDPWMAEKLAPKVAPHPFGTKRVSLERTYFEVFNQSNVDLIDLTENPIDEVTQEGVRTQDGIEHRLDVLVLATGFDSVSGGLTNIDIRGSHGTSVKEEWAQGVHTWLGLCTRGFPNLFFAYGPQAPTGFSNGPTTIETQAPWIVDLLLHMRQESYSAVEPTLDAQMRWKTHVNELGDAGLFSEAKSWYFGDNIPGKPREALNYMTGVPKYRKELEDCKSSGYSGFEFSRI
ncbi:uncharacterized protein Z520_12237 [Fonsecaea multimorphosa CBS 102226]|uniref:FAD/NAD(P)-binding domain-containing protein n=1 Tax=Fonsecaea multimorphosa CBS 102226 TaxID=1442371 RepID=A0A0D2K6U6_9EURO|nr:uncharacterized protein Z520_12237 [Fonsecaea multimorphosa CBS 102226]KIX92083.1 hypothetical protein Z520_12237 [Fonsecaea multimorphosa CBS 102226]OAL17449.1 hypothetical protein AYO22_11672 [Fonsecaea multimorphosa]